jgi:predicted phosphodiesterase
MPRLVLLSDTHSRHDKLDVPDADILIHACYATRTGTYNQLRSFGKWLRSLPHAVKIVVAGNHDRIFQTAPAAARHAIGEGRDGLIYLQDSGVTVDGFHFWGSPWQPTFQDGVFNLPRGSESLERQWSLIPNHTDVLITHSPPWGILDVADSKHLGCELLRDRVEQVQPRFQIFGHIHEAAGLYESEKTTFVNASICDDQYQPVNLIRTVGLR